MRSKNINYVAFQPGFEKFANTYHGFIPARDSFLQQNVSDFYEIKNGNFSEKAIVTIPDGCTDIMFAFDGNDMKIYISTGVRVIKKFYFGSLEYLFGIRFKPGCTYHIFHEKIKKFVHKPVNANHILKDSHLI